MGPPISQAPLVMERSGRGEDSKVTSNAAAQGREQKGRERRYWKAEMKQGKKVLG